MDLQKIRLKFEKSLGEELYSLLQGKVIEEILEVAMIQKSDDLYQTIYDGYYFKISKALSPHLYELCNDTLKTLKFKEDINFFIVNNPDVNAFSIPRQDKYHNHIIAFNAGLIDLLDDDELRFVIGHEVGHLISKNAKIEKIIKFVYQDKNKMPLSVKNKVNFWMRFSELSADRYGFIASPNLEKVVSSFFKMSSGISTSKIKFNYKDYLKYNEEILKDFKHSGWNGEIGNHPVNPFRIEAIKIFAKSELYKSFLTGEIKYDSKIENEMDTLLAGSMNLIHSDMDILRLNILASAGYLMAKADKELVKEEIEEIIESLSAYTLFPKLTLKDIIKSGRIKEIFENSVTELIATDPSEKYDILQYLIDICLADNKIKESEIQFLFYTGKELLDINFKEISQQIAQAIRNDFSPKLIKV